MANGNVAAKQAAAKKRSEERAKRIAERKANAGKPGYDKYGVKTQAQKKKDANTAEVVSRRRRRDEEIAASERRRKSQEAGQKQAEKIKKTISKPSTVDQSELRKKRAAQTNKGSSTETPPKAPDSTSRTTKPGSSARGGFNTKTKELNIKTPKVETPNLVSQGQEGRDAKKKVSGSQKRSDARKKRRFDKADRLREKASKYKAGDKKAERLEKRAKRQVQIGRGNKKTRAGSILKGIGKGAQALGHAYAYGNTNRLKGKSVTSKKGGEGNKASKGFDKFTSSKKPSLKTTKVNTSLTKNKNNKLTK